MGMCIRTSTLKNQSGQALLEYLLLTLISVLIIFGIVYKFSDAFRQYTQQWFSSDNGYLFCLIENGVLPGDEGCQDQLPKFDLKNGKAKAFTPYQAPPSSNAANSKAGGSSSSKSSSNPSTDKGSSSSTSSARGTTEGRSASVPTNSADRISGSGGFSARTSTSDTGNGNSYGNSGKAKGGNQDPDLASSLGGGPSDAAGGRRGSGLVTDGALSKLLGNKTTNVVPTNDRDLKTAREIAADKAAKKKAEMQDSPFTFGNFLRWLIIAAIIFILIFFVGSQFVAVQRGKKRR